MSLYVPSPIYGLSISIDVQIYNIYLSLRNYRLVKWLINHLLGFNKWFAVTGVFGIFKDNLVWYNLPKHIREDF